VEFDLVTLSSGNHKGKTGCIKSISEDVCRVILHDGIISHVKVTDVILCSLTMETEAQSQDPTLPNPGITIPKRSRNPRPLFDYPSRDDNPIPEREANLLALAFPKLFQTGVGDMNQPRLRSLDEFKGEKIKVFMNQCMYHKHHRFQEHPRFNYVVFNMDYRYRLFQTKSFFLKHRKPTSEDFLPENRKKTISEMRAYAAKLPTTPGFKLQRRAELEAMCDQIAYMTANKLREERLMVEQEYEDYVSSDEDSNDDHGPPSFWKETQAQTNPQNGTDADDIEGGKKVQQRPIEGRIPCFWATVTTAPFRSSLFP
jgi:hypothetical protein